ncbi:hypothetical protein LAD12857_09660 [Lacrimispora amygdalina]|uniref:DUF6774 domain-containing protein n=1 Tax=Lacrimispora amygdalina TaxID=253257 RepID=A0A3E2NF22_9FIRM|nr:DUF6774 domain-containing protein [Clostridium indicum]RFZ79481.1 hypothetical protein DS742_08000 [Clostridium indicum]
MQSCELVTLVSSIACCLAKDRTAEEIALLSCVFNQLGDTLETIAAHRVLCCSDDKNGNIDDDIFFRF